MTLNKFQKELFKYQDEQYAKFSSKLNPNIDPNCFIGVRVPQIRLLAKELYLDTYKDEFLNDLPHKYFEENMLHGLLLEQVKDYDECIDELNKFLPYVDNWAVSDSMKPKCFKKNKDKLIKQINIWIKSKHTYMIRFSIEALMTHFLDEDFDEKYLKLVSKVKSNEYYVNMMVAWYFATALAKHWGETIGYIENKLLDPWINNKTIQKAIESYRISDEQKQYLRKFKI